MWYFSWILGIGLACAFSILNAMWFELRELEHQRQERQATGARPADAGRSASMRSGAHESPGP